MPRYRKLCYSFPSSLNDEVKLPVRIVENHHDARSMNAIFMGRMYVEMCNIEEQIEEIVLCLLFNDC
jgi:hypothetical protein